MNKTGKKAMRACSAFARCVACRRCLHYQTCKRLGAPVSRLGRYVAHLQRLTEQAQAGLTFKKSRYSAVVGVVPASLEDEAGILAKVRVHIPALHGLQFIYLNGGESDYRVLSLIKKAWGEIILNKQ